MITHIVNDWLFSPCCVEHQDEFIFERVAVAYSRDYNEVGRAQIKLALLQNVCTLVIRCVPAALFSHKYRGQILGAVSTTDKTFGPFSEWDFSPKKNISAARFQLTECNQRKFQWKFYQFTLSRIHL